jgi:aminoglycoside/choline kinase family phosphotransferase
MDQKLSSVSKQEFRTIWRRILEPHLLDRHVWTLRDFHSPNLFWLEEREGLKRIGLIDFQDMLWGHPAYDVGSLLQDARTFVSEQLELDLFETYIRRRSEDDEKFDVAAFAKSYVAFSTQRTLKILGIFVRLCKRDGKPEYLKKIPMLKTYLLRNINHVLLTDFREWLDRCCPTFFDI